MSNAVVRLPEKRANSGSDSTPKKHLKIGDVDSGKGMKVVQSEFCMICGCCTDHSDDKCRNKATALGMGCPLCYEPCEIKEHQDKVELMLKFCSGCGARGKHWSADCPSPIYDDDDMYF